MDILFQYKGIFLSTELNLCSPPRPQGPPREKLRRALGTRLLVLSEAAVFASSKLKVTFHNHGLIVNSILIVKFAALGNLGLVLLIQLPFARNFAQFGSL